MSAGKRKPSNVFKCFPSISNPWRRLLARSHTASLGMPSRMSNHCLCGVRNWPGHYLHRRWCAHICRSCRIGEGKIAPVTIAKKVASVGRKTSVGRSITRLRCIFPGKLDEKLLPFLSNDLSFRRHFRKT
jgi:hypothetical protein